MPSRDHEAPLLLFRNDPGLIPRLLAGAGMALPARAQARLADASFGQVVPVERRADLVVLLEENGKALAGLVVEVQLDVRKEKLFVWPLYAAALFDRIRVPSTLVVVAPNANTAAWAAQAITGFQHGSPFRPMVIGPSMIPVITDAEVAGVAPELATLSAMAHVNEEPETGVAALSAAARLDSERLRLYVNLILHSANENTRKLLESKMNLNNFNYEDPIVTRLIAHGEERGKASAVLAVLKARGLPVSDDIRARIEACQDLAQLDVWLARAVTATSAADVVAE